MPEVELESLEAIETGETQETEETNFYELLTERGLDDAERATFFLEASNWNVDLAISSFFDDPDGAVNVEPQPINPNASVSQPPTDESSEQFKSANLGKLKLRELLCTGLDFDFCQD